MRPPARPRPGPGPRPARPRPPRGPARCARSRSAGALVGAAARRPPRRGGPRAPPRAPRRPRARAAAASPSSASSARRSGGPARRAASTTARIEAQALGDAQRVRRARLAELELVERPQGADVHAHRRVGRARALARPGLHLGVVGGGQHQGALVHQPGDDRLGEARTLVGIGAGGRLVQQHQGARRRAASITAISRRTWAEKVDRLSAIDWSSPMSASTRSNTGRRAEARRARAGRTGAASRRARGS